MKPSEKQQTIRIVLSALFMIAVMIAIFFFSSQNGEESSKISDSLAEIITHGVEVPPGQSISNVPVYAGLSVRKLAHLTLYMLLGLSSFLFAASLFGMRNASLERRILRTVLCSFAICLVYACLDEFHQKFVDGRAASLYDVGIDALGFTLLIALSAAVFLAASYFKRKRDGSAAKPKDATKR